MTSFWQLMFKIIGCDQSLGVTRQQPEHSMCNENSPESTLFQRDKHTKSGKIGIKKEKYPQTQ